MNTKTVSKVAVILIVLCLGSWMIFGQINQALTKQPPQVQSASTVLPSSTSVPVSQSDVLGTFTSRDGKFEFSYPKNWLIEDTPIKQVNGKFGKIIQSWVLTDASQEASSSGVVNKNVVKINFEIQQNDSNASLTQVLGCKDKAVACEDVTLGGTLYKKRSFISKTGLVTIALGTIFDSSILMISGELQSGDKQADNLQSVQGIFNSFTFR